MSASIGVTIATRNRRDTLLRTLGHLRALAERPPIVVVDDASSDGTADAVRARWPEVTVIALAQRHGAAARNVGVQALSTPYVAFSDDDSWWASGSLARASQLLGENRSVGLLAARVLVGLERRLDPTCAAMAGSPLAAADRTDMPGTPVLGFIACGSVVRRSAFLAVGGFEARYGLGGEERLLASDLAAAGWQVRYVSELVAHHWPRACAGRRGRAAQVVRNDLWSAWLRRPARRLPAASVRVLAAGGVRLDTLRGAVAAVRGLPWVARERRPFPREVEAATRLLERDG